MIISEKECNKYDDNQLVKMSLEQLDYFSCLYNKYESRMTNYIKKISSASDEEAEDILQEAFMKVWRNLNEYEPELKFSSWIYRIVHNEAISYWRKKKSYGKDNTIDIDDANIRDIVEEEKEEVDLSSTKLAVMRLLVSMPSKYREVLILKYFEELSYEEISDVLKIPEGTVATRLSRAKKSFEKLAGGTMQSIYA